MGGLVFAGCFYGSARFLDLGAKSTLIVTLTGAAAGGIFFGTITYAIKSRNFSGQKIATKVFEELKTWDSLNIRDAATKYYELKLELRRYVLLPDMTSLEERIKSAAMKATEEALKDLPPIAELFS